MVERLLWWLVFVITFAWEHTVFVWIDPRSQCINVYVDSYASAHTAFQKGMQLIPPSPAVCENAHLIASSPFSILSNCISEKLYLILSSTSLINAGDIFTTKFVFLLVKVIYALL